MAHDELTRRALLSGAATAGLLAVLSAEEGPAEVRGAALAADLAAAVPYVHKRGQWHARAPRRRALVLDRAPARIIVHHTATANIEDLSVRQAYRLSRWIQRFHMDSRHWDDIGEQLTISRGGHIMEGRNRTLEAVRTGRHAVGTQTMPDPSYNRWTFGIENEGNYVRTAVPARLWSSLVATCTWLCRAYDLDPHRAIVGHRDFIATACPGDRLYARLPELRRTVARRMTLPGHP